MVLPFKVCDMMYDNDPDDMCALHFVIHSTPIWKKEATFFSA